MNQAIAEFCVKAYDFLFPIASIGVAIVALVLLPMAIFRTTRRVAGISMRFAAYPIGITTWFLAAAVSFGTWGWQGLC